LDTDFFKPVLFVTGFIVGGGITYLALWNYTTVGLVLLIIVPIVGGILLGVIFVFLSVVGIFVLGALLGYVLFAMFMSSKDGGLIHSRLVVYILDGAVPFVFGVVAVIFQKPLIITATALCGSYAAVAGADRYVHGGFSQVIPNLIGNHHELIDADYKTYIEIAVCALVAILGIVVQATKTAKGYYHKHTVEKGYSSFDDE